MNRRVRLTPGWASDFGALCSLQEELDLHGLEREDDTSALGTVEHARGKQCRNIAVNGFDITSHAARRLANRDRTCPTEYLEQLPTLGREHLTTTILAIDWPRISARHSPPVHLEPARGALLQIRRELQQIPGFGLAGLDPLAILGLVAFRVVAVERRPQHRGSADGLGQREEHDGAVAGSDGRTQIVGAQCREREGMRRGIAELETARRTQARHGGIVQRVRRVGKKPLHLIGRGALRLELAALDKFSERGMHCRL